MLKDMTEDMLEALVNVPREAEGGDFIGEDGLLYCGKCRTKKEHIVPWINQEARKVSIMCRCRMAEDQAIQDRMRKEEEVLSIRRAKMSSMMDDTFRSATFENFKVNKSNVASHKQLLNYCKGFKKMLERNQGLLLYGSVGTGKSYTAACIANYLLDHNWSVAMTSFVRILQEVQGFDKERAEFFTNKLNSVSLLIIDDLGAERSTDYALEKVYGIIDGRYRAKKPLILTTNLTLGQMQEASDIRYERIYDRIFEMCYPMEFAGVSWRKREAAQRFEETRKLLEG